MIKISFSLAIALYLFLFLILVIGFWIFYNLDRDKPLSYDQNYLRQCPYCTFVFFDYWEQGNEIRKCPNCQSYIMQKPDGAAKVKDV